MNGYRPLALSRYGVVFSLILSLLVIPQAVSASSEIFGDQALSLQSVAPTYTNRSPGKIGRRQLVILLAVATAALAQNPLPKTEQAPTPKDPPIVVTEHLKAELRAQNYFAKAAEQLPLSADLGVSRKDMISATNVFRELLNHNAVAVLAANPNTPIAAVSQPLNTIIISRRIWPSILTEYQAILFHEIMHNTPFQIHTMKMIESMTPLLMDRLRPYIDQTLLKDHPELLRQLVFQGAWDVDAVKKERQKGNIDLERAMILIMHYTWLAEVQAHMLEMGFLNWSAEQEHLTLNQYIDRMIERHLPMDIPLAAYKDHLIRQPDLANIDESVLTKYLRLEMAYDPNHVTDNFESTILNYSISSKKGLTRMLEAVARAEYQPNFTLRETASNPTAIQNFLSWSRRTILHAPLDSNGIPLIPTPTTLGFIVPLGVSHLHDLFQNRLMLRTAA